MAINVLVSLAFPESVDNGEELLPPGPSLRLCTVSNGEMVARAVRVMEKGALGLAKRMCSDVHGLGEGVTTPLRDALMKRDWVSLGALRDWRKLLKGKVEEGSGAPLWGTLGDFETLKYLLMWLISLQKLVLTKERQKTAYCTI